MKIHKILTPILVFSVLIAGCVSSGPTPKKVESEETRVVRQHIAKGEFLEQENSFTGALEQYKLALTIAPENKDALQHKKAVLSRLWETAQLHYKKGLEFDGQGKYESARKEYLSALQNWPDYKEAKERLTPGGVVDEAKDYILHTILSGESVSKLGMIYYGDFKKHEVIGKFNVLKDVTKVRVGETLKIPVLEGFSLSDLKQKQEKYLTSVKKTAASGMGKPDEETPMETDTPGADPEALLKPIDESTEPPDLAMQEAPVQEPPVKASTAMAPKKAVPSEPEKVETPAPAKEIVTATLVAPDETPPAAIADITTSKEYQQGIEQFNNKKYPESISSFLAAAQMEPDNKTLKDYLFKSHFQQGLALFNAEDYLAAKDNFQSALTYDTACEKCPDYIEKCEATYKEKHYNLGIHYFGKEQLNKAIEEWKLVKNIDPDYKDVTPNLQKAEMLFKRLESIKKSTTE
jgi:tetratricopeptide (TPR) repeat protein